MNDQSEMLRNLLAMLASTRDGELDCGHVYEMMDEAAELKAQGVDLTTIMPEIEQHLSLCKCCCTEFDMLMEIVQTSGEQNE